MQGSSDIVYAGVFVWDKAKNEANERKHGITFEVASRAFNDPLMCSDYDYFHSVNEERERHIGRVSGYYIVTVITTDRADLIRIISARRATKEEVEVYEQNAARIQGY